MAKNDKEAKTKKPKKKHWYSYLADAYKVAKTSYSWLPFALAGTFCGVLLVNLIVAAVTKSWIFFSISGLLLALLLTLVVLTQAVKYASYKQLENMPGAVSAVLGQLKRGWAITEEPVRFNVKTQDMVFRAIGRPGVVLISEGPANRVNKLLNEERRAIKRIAPSAPVHTLKVGKEKGQIPIRNLQKALRKLPKNISNQEVAALVTRFDAVGTNPLPIPKGIDPTKMKVSRRAMRG